MGTSSSKYEHSNDIPMQSKGGAAFTVRTKSKYIAQNEEELSFEADEILGILKLDKDPWWYALNKNRERGYVNNVYVIVNDDRPNNLDAWYDITRRETENYLYKPGNPHGTYIIRPGREKNNFVLSVRFFDRNGSNCFVKHFSIQKNDSVNGFFIIRNKTFPTISDMISHYTDEKRILSKPYPRHYKPTINFLNLEVERDNITLERELGRGNFGVVHSGKWNSTYKVAVKMVTSGETDRTGFIQEAKRLHKLQDHRIVQILGICTKPHVLPMYIVTEFMENGSLKGYLGKTNRYNQFLDFPQLIDIMAQISEGMVFLEANKVVHRDLRADNCLVDLNGDVKIADFGLARETTDYVYKLKESQFPVKWTSPESMRTKEFTSRSDVWSFGVLMYEIVTYGGEPYPGMRPYEVEQFVAHNSRMKNPHGLKLLNGVVTCKCPDRLYTLMTSCWHEHPDYRCSFRALVDRLPKIVTYAGYSKSIGSNYLY